MNSNLTNMILRNFAKISPRFFGTTASLSQKIAGIQTDHVQKMLSVTWTDGTKGLFPYVWLRDCSHDPLTFHITPSIMARKMLLMDFDPEVVPNGVEMGSDGDKVDIKWPGGVDSSYSSDWLKLRNLSNESRMKIRRKAYLDEVETWGSEKIGEVLPYFEYAAVMNDSKAMHDFLMGLCKYGLAFLHGAPSRVGVLKELEAKIGFITTSHFGDFFSVITKPEGQEGKKDEKGVVSDLAYTALRLGLHTDQPCLQRNPEIQVLHFIRQTDREGGENEFADGFQIAEQLKQEKPDVYKLLTTVPIEYVQEGWDVVPFDYMAKQLLLELDEDGNPRKCSYSNQWRSWFVHLPVDQVLPMYRAIKTFMDYCYQPRNLLQRKSKEGEVVFFANNRVLHGRTAYEANPGDERHLEGCYYSWDIVKSKIRLIRDELNLPENQPSA